jgi:hypothetical protein
MNHRHSRRLPRVPIAASANIRVPRSVSVAPSADIGSDIFPVTGHQSGMNADASSYPPARTAAGSAQPDPSATLRRADSRSADRAYTSHEAFAGLAWNIPKADSTLMPTGRCSQSNTPGTTDTLLGLLGHSRECSKLAKAGRIVSCACRTTPLDDPAVAVGLTMHFARTAMARGLPMPNSIVSLLESRIHEGDPACRIVGQWLEERGLLGITCSATKGDA